MPEFPNIKRWLDQEGNHIVLVNRKIGYSAYIYRFDRDRIFDPPEVELTSVRNDPDVLLADIESALGRYYEVQEADLPF